MINDINEDDVLKVFKLYIGLKLHFSSKKYVYNDSFGHKSLNAHSMNNRKDINFFINVADEYYKKDELLRMKMISLFKHNPDTWIGDLIDKSSDNVHTKRLSNIYNLENVIKKDVETVKDFIVHKDVNLKDLLICNNDRPLIVKKFKLSDEFLALLDFKFQYLLQETENPLWKKRSFSLYKYKYLIENVDDSILSIFNDLD